MEDHTNKEQKMTRQQKTIHRPISIDKVFSAKGLRVYRSKMKSGYTSVDAKKAARKAEGRG